MPRILVIQHEDGTGPGYLGECLSDTGLDLHVLHPYLGEELPESLCGYDGFIVLGGTQSPFDDKDAPWLPSVRHLIRLALGELLPLLGVCLGGEMLADVAGGEVTHGSRGPEVGLRRLTKQPGAVDDPIFRDLPDEAPAVEWHWEELHTLPPDAVSLLGTELYPHQAFRIGDAAWGLQFHPEVLSDAVSIWAAHEREHLATEGRTPEDVANEVREAEPELRQVWRGLAVRWAALTRSEDLADAYPQDGARDRR
ncbi:type 1 glutamine amidotransferase [Leekyejoonella antrihumi]|uniref:Type 1 glutamine amidotransferase n=1 Tax=Leekyejoonella antrihumi TaxID=1660198 RepID=A0A563E7L4_9MICO|nr:type 1 glutamine amidotransferase [Leekyejoonella antrihumi]TWP38510.1 type 1 glutamine amidotransferase [Leekyejoonella antrihumi]